MPWDSADMAREHGRLLTSIWQDIEWKALTRDEQWMYELLLSQANIEQSGLIPLTAGRWGQLAAKTTAQDVRGFLRGLHDKRFVVMDEDTEEVLVRSLIRRDGVLSTPNIFKAALRSAQAVQSQNIRATLLSELLRVRETVWAMRVPAGHEPVWTLYVATVVLLGGDAPAPPNGPEPDRPLEGYDEPYGEPSANGSRTLPGTVPGTLTETPGGRGGGRGGGFVPDPSTKVDQRASRAHAREAPDPDPPRAEPPPRPPRRRGGAHGVAARYARSTSTPRASRIVRAAATANGIGQQMVRDAFWSFARRLDEILAENQAAGYTDDQLTAAVKACLDKGLGPSLLANVLTEELSRRPKLATVPVARSTAAVASYAASRAATKAAQAALPSDPDHHERRALPGRTRGA